MLVMYRFSRLKLSVKIMKHPAIYSVVWKKKISTQTCIGRVDVKPKPELLADRSNRENVVERARRRRAQGCDHLKEKDHCYQSASEMGSFRGTPFGDERDRL